MGDFCSSKEREIAFISIQKELKARGIELRRDQPKMYSELIDWVKGQVVTFPPIVLHSFASSGIPFCSLLTGGYLVN